jgi:uncharacterized protein YkwD
MRINLQVTCIFLVLMISACGSPQAPPVTASPTQAEVNAGTATETNIETPAATQTPPPQASATSTPTTPVPTNPPDCTNKAVFVSDVTVPDNSVIAYGVAFTKTWRIKNAGTCVWGPDYTLTHYSGERMLAPPSVPLSVTFPEQTLDISVELRALGETGPHQAYFVIKNPAGLIMKIDNDSRLWVVIDVTRDVASEPTTVGSIPVTGDGATCAFSTDALKIAELINTLNAYRAQNGLPAYTTNDLLSQAATAHANDMACNKLFGHNGSNGSTPTTRVAATGYNAASITENVYGSYPPLSGQEVMNWWKNDKTDLRHNQNLLSSVYTEIGVGYSFFDNFGFYVLVFGTPK